jgi:glycosyltransferase involved in cell wall biosynthesis
VIRGRRSVRAEPAVGEAMTNSNSPARTDSRIHVVQATLGMGLGGMERVVMDLCRYVDPARFRFTVCCISQRGALADELEAEGIPVVFCENQTRLGKYLRGLELGRILREQRADILHTHNTTAFIDGLIGARIGGVPVVVHTDHCKNYPIEWRRTVAENVASRLVDRMVAVSHHTKSELMRYEKIPDARLTVIHNGINPRPTGNVPLDVLRRELGLSPDHMIVGTIGRLEPQKGLDLLLAAAPRVIDACPNARFLIVGGGSLDAELRAQAVALGIADRVVFTGWRTDAIDLMPLFDCFVSTSNFEGLPMVLLEAMAFGKPIVATDVGGVPELLQDGFNGFSIGDRRPELVAAALLRIIRDDVLRRRLGQNSRARYAERFTAQAMASAYQRIYERYVQEKRVQAA